MGYTTQECLSSLNEKQKGFAENFCRFLAQGKLNKKSSCLITTDLQKCINFVLERRVQIGISDSEAYLFANPKSKRSRYFLANQVLRYFCSKHKLNFKKLCATKLRKHLATSTALLATDRQRIIRIIIKNNNNSSATDLIYIKIFISNGRQKLT